MRTFKVVNKTYVKSDNKADKIMARFTYVLIGFILISMIINVFIGNKDIVISLFRNLTLSLLFSSVIAYIINICKKKYSYINIYLHENTLFIALIIGLFGYDTNIYVLFGVTLLCFIIKNVFKNIDNSCVLYGILGLIIYKYYNHLGDLWMVTSNYKMTSLEVKEISVLKDMINLKYLTPLLSFASILYLFHKRGIKYNLVFSYLGTYLFMTLLIGLLNGKIWFVLLELLYSNILFYSIFILSDYKASPTIGNGQVIYGIMMAFLTVILRFMVPELALVLPLIIGSIFINKPLDKVSYKFKYNEKLYYLTLGLCLVVIMISSIII